MVAATVMSLNPPCRVAYGPAQERSLTMSVTIALPCVGVKDTACLAVCPVDCIHPTTEEETFAAAPQLSVDADPCVDCNLCVGECPVSAIFGEGDLPAEWQEFVEKNAAYYR